MVEQFVIEMSDNPDHSVHIKLADDRKSCVISDLVGTYQQTLTLDELTAMMTALQVIQNQIIKAHSSAPADDE